MKKGEFGIAAVFLALTLVVIFGLLAFLIDTSRVSLNEGNLQFAADSAALAAANELDGTLAGWRNAKRAALATLRNNSNIASSQQGGQLLFESGTVDPLESTSDFEGNEGRIGNLTIRIERGINWTHRDGTSEFLSLEGKEVGRVSNGGVVPIPLYFGLPIYLISNAVQVSVDSASLKSSFGRALGVQQLRVGKRATIALLDESITECVVPAAIPACALLVNGDSALSNNYQVDAYDADSQCQREVLVTEADPLASEAEGGYYQSRAEGMTRASLYQSIPLSGETSSNLAIPLFGTWAVPDLNASSGRVGTNIELLDILSSSGGCVPVALGTRVKPLHNAVGAGGLYTSTWGMELADSLRKLLEESEMSFSDIFGDSQDDNRSFPRLITQESDPKRTYQTREGVRIQLHMAKQDEEARWTNPMCHDFEGDVIKANDGSSPVREVTLMVVAPSHDGEPVADMSYCDLSSTQYSGQSNIAPLAARTDPIVVGFVKATLFDFNFKNLGGAAPVDSVLDKPAHSYSFMFDGQLTTVSTGSGASIDPQKQAEEKAIIKEKARHYVEQVIDWAEQQENQSAEPCESQLMGICGRPSGSDRDSCSQTQPCADNLAESGLSNSYSWCILYKSDMTSWEVSEYNLDSNVYCWETHVFCYKSNPANCIAMGPASSYHSRVGRTVNYVGYHQIGNRPPDPVPDAPDPELAQVIRSELAQINSESVNDSSGGLPELPFEYDAECIVQAGGSAVDLESFDRCVSGDIDVEACKAFLSSLNDEVATADQNIHCLPERIAGCTDPLDKACYRGLKSHAAQFGCGGMRLRLSCNQERLSTTRSPQELIPALAK